MKYSFISKSSKLVIHGTKIGGKIINNVMKYRIATEAGLNYNIEPDRLTRCQCSETNPFYCSDVLHKRREPEPEPDTVGISINN